MFEVALVVTPHVSEIPHVVFVKTCWLVDTEFVILSHHLVLHVVLQGCRLDFLRSDAWLH